MTAGIRFTQGGLRFHRALHGIHSAPELRKHTVPRRVRDAAPVIRNGLVEDRTALGQRLERADLVSTHQSGIAFNVSREDRHQPSPDIA
ncbi:MAG: hypothetical protein E5W82_32470 [Mesorhizobium sp.]|nr:MAG: hypothetical protein E5W82_32470 [Mesorhizobium sp.]